MKLNPIEKIFDDMKLSDDYEASTLDQGLVLGVEVDSMSFGAFMMIIRSEYYPYLMTYFQLPPFRSQITTGATTTINQITGSMMDKVTLPVPDKATMNMFATFVSQIDKSKSVIQRSLAETQTLFDSLVQEYFG